MPSPSPHVFDTGSDGFADDVIAASHEVPVLVDFWAPWCGPCRVLGPTLERVVDGLGGAVRLAKVDSDQNPELSARYGVRGIPNVQLFKDGEVVDSFVGVLPESQVKAFLARHVTTAADEHVAAARLREEAGDAAAARASYEAALAADPAAGEAHLGLARLSLAAGDPDGAERHLAAVPPTSDAAPAAEALRAGLELAREALATGSREEIERRADLDPADLAARFALGGHLLASGRHRDALDCYLEVARLDPKWNGEAARKAMVVVFGVLGVRHPISDEYRDKLRALYY